MSMVDSVNGSSQVVGVAVSPDDMVWKSYGYLPDEGIAVAHVASDGRYI